MKDIYIEFKNSAIKGDVRDSVHGSNSATGQNSKPTVEVDSWAHVIRQPKSASASTSSTSTRTCSLRPANSPPRCSSAATAPTTS